ncbi:MAG: hypothetical protein KF900_03295 [Bacteroidetes bacterium]|nr:hypothetical protein [Bacteroidota bacterium]
MTKKVIITLGLFSIILLSSFVDDFDFPHLTNLKSVKEYKQWADTTKTHEKDKWLKSHRVYYPTGQIKQVLYIEYNGDTTSLRQYSLNKNGTVDKDIWYNRFLKKWMKGDEYVYRKNEQLPYMYKDKNNYKCYFIYDANGKLLNKKHSDNKNEDFAEYEFFYDTIGLLMQQIEYGFFGGEKHIKRVYVYEYEKDQDNKVIKRETFFVPSHKSDVEIRTDKKGNQMTTYYGFTAKDKTLTETIYFNTKGERTKKIEYDRQGQPQFVWTYEYEYYE